MKNIYYVYLHIRPDTGNVFYVGKGKGRRAFLSNQRNKHWHHIVEKAGGFEVSFVAQGLAEEEAFKIEKDTIAYYGRVNLSNYTDGGDGASGSKRTEQFKELMRKKMLGRKFSDETIEKMRASAKLRGPDFQEKRTAKLRGRKLSESHKEKIRQAGIGRIVTDETREKLSLVHKGKKKKPDAVARMALSKSKPVYCHNNGITYSSMREAARQLGLNSSHISDVCRNKVKHTKGFIFSRA